VSNNQRNSVIVMGVVLILFGVGHPAWAAEDGAAELKTEPEKIGYIIGSMFANDLKKKGLDAEVDLNALIRGLKDVLAGVTPAVDQAQTQKIMQAFTKKFAAKQQAKKQAEAVKTVGADNAWKLKLKKPKQMTFDSAKDYFWILDTNKGKIKIKLMPDVAPMHATSTIFLTNKKFYDGIKFHRVIPGFMAQGGCPLGTGTGGPGYKYAGEFDSKVKHDRPYLLSMANAGPDTDGSQFFITFVPTPHLDSKHTIFGEVADDESKAVVKKLEKAGTRGAGATKEELIITKASIEELAKK
jgi:peptidyl-prolyl cis-trans isomerase B (cyclophilin B)